MALTSRPRLLPCCARQVGDSFPFPTLCEKGAALSSQHSAKAPHWGSMASSWQQSVGSHEATSPAGQHLKLRVCFVPALAGRPSLAEGLAPAVLPGRAAPSL